MSIKIDIVSGFLGAGKTTLIKKLLTEKLGSEKVVLIENEFGEIGIDGGILKNSGIEIKEMNSGCICCSLVGDFSSALNEVLKRYNPDRVIIEPSGVGKLSGVIEACKKMEKQAEVAVNMCIAVVDAVKYRIFINNFGEFFEDQLKYAKTIILSRTQMMQQDKLSAVVKDIRQRNNNANIVTTEWTKLSGADIVSVAEQDASVSLDRKVRLKLRNGGNPAGHNHGACSHSAKGHS
ncbi:MAG TPA: GTP-binding protein, partial [Ruminiclostridium sp.]|nr:GTP-binding protein [Ruminiclostridium sp.]